MDKLKVCDPLAETHPAMSGEPALIIRAQDPEFMDIVKLYQHRYHYSNPKRAAAVEKLVTDAENWQDANEIVFDRDLNGNLI